jgi:hypothetical protein
LDKPKPKKSDALALLAKASFGSRRRYSAGRLLVGFLFLLIPVAILVWFLWPHRHLPAMVLAAFDQVSRPGELTRISAQIEPAGAAGTIDLSGQKLYFQEPRSGFLAEAETDSQGAGTVETTFNNPASSFECTVRYKDDNPKHAVPANARIFLWPADAALLVVDLDRALADAQADLLITANNLEIQPRNGAREALQAAAKDYRIVYVSEFIDRPWRYNKVRAWLDRGWVSPNERFPAGPLVPSVLVAGFKTSFQGKIVGVAGTGELAEQFRRSGLMTYSLDEQAEPQEGIEKVDSWGELKKKLSR